MWQIIKVGYRRAKAGQWLVMFCQKYPPFGIAGFVRQNWGKSIGGVHISSNTWWVKNASR